MGLFKSILKTVKDYPQFLHYHKNLEQFLDNKDTAFCIYRAISESQKAGPNNSVQIRIINEIKDNLNLPYLTVLASMSVEQRDQLKIVLDRRYSFARNGDIGSMSPETIEAINRYGIQLLETIGIEESEAKDYLQHLRDYNYSAFNISFMAATEFKEVDYQCWSEKDIPYKEYIWPVVLRSYRIKDMELKEKIDCISLNNSFIFSFIFNSGCCANNEELYTLFSLCVASSRKLSLIPKSESEKLFNRSVELFKQIQSNIKN